MLGDRERNVGGRSRGRGRKGKGLKIEKKYKKVKRRGTKNRSAEKGGKKERVILRNEIVWGRKWCVVK